MKKKPVKALKKRLDTLFSRFIRLRHADHRQWCTCVTCGKQAHYKEMQNGHFVGRGKLSTRFDETNCNVQCVGCNMFKAGEQYKHGKYTDKTYGTGTAEGLMVKGNKICKMSAYDYESLIEQYKIKVKDLGGTI